MKTLENRIYFLDNLKVALIMLVVAHHAGQPYGGSEGWWYFKTVDSPGLGSFFAVNAAFFMSLFFMISAYFMPATFNKKGASKFLKERFQRLGIPLLIGFFIIIPLLMYTYYINFRGYPSISYWKYYISTYFGIGDQPVGWTGPSWPDMNFGHLWFIEHLLVYALLYAIFRMIIKKTLTTETKNKFPGHVTILLFTLFVAVVTFVIRIWYPIDHWVGFFGIIQTEFAHVPQYASFFILGLLAARRGWMGNIPKSLGLSWLAIGVILVLIMYSGKLSFFQKGGLTWGSLAYSVFETFLCAALCIGIIYLFYVKFNKASILFQNLSSNTFTVYVIHVPVVVILQYAFENMSMSAYVKFLLVTFFGIILCFGISHFIIGKISYLIKSYNKLKSSKMIDC